MPILFRCRCGRSMVLNSDLAGTSITCPNCNRSLKVPSGKERGIELAPGGVAGAAGAAGPANSSKSCPRCKKDVPAASKFCPWCGAAMPPPTSTSCPRCAKAVPAASKFCPSCGVAMSVSPPPAAKAPLTTREPAAPQPPAAKPAAARPPVAKAAPTARTTPAAKTPPAAKASPAAQLSEAIQAVPHTQAAVQKTAAPADGASEEGLEEEEMLLEGSWWSRLSAGKKVVLIIAMAAVLMAGLIVVFRFVGQAQTTGKAKELVQSSKEVLEAGKKLEKVGPFDEAYNLYVSHLLPPHLRGKLSGEDRAMYSTMEVRCTAIRYLATSAEAHQGLYWQPRSQAEVNSTLARLRNDYPKYRQLCVALADAGLAAIQMGMTAENRATFDEKVSQTLDAYVNLVSQTTPQQQCQTSFQTVLGCMKELATVNQRWEDTNARATYLRNIKGNLNELKAWIAESDFPETLWQPGRH